MYTPKRPGGRAAEIATPGSAEVPASPRVNDDAAERRRRRKSAIERRRSNMVTPRRLSMKAPVFSQSPQLGSPATPAAFSVQLPRLTPEELNQRYEEWMKIAADNKINANNTWDFALIDYFYDMSLLRDGDSINFQKASCTLDGCVKIYSSRVDSVASETGRLLSGLAEAPGKRGRQAADEAADEAADGEEAEGSGAGAKQRSRRAARSATTLAKDFASISVKKLDLEFSVDPLFKKTSADFDEGGARGLLLNHLGFDADGRIVFDASDSGALVDGDGDDNDNDNGNGDEARDEGAPPQGKRHRPTPVDISSIGDMLGAIVGGLADAHICPSLADFEFTRDASLDFALLKESLRDDSPETPLVGGIESDDEDANVGGGLAAAGGSDAEGDDMGHFLNFDEADAGPVPLETASTLLLAEAEEAADNGEEGAPLAGGFSVASLRVAEDEDNLLSYFDTTLAKGWAGPEHWRLPISRAAMQKQLQAGGEDGTGGDGAAAAGTAADEAETKRKRTEKQAFFTDFVNGPDVDAAQLFAKPARASAITMAKKAAHGQTHTLPEDVHFSSKNLFNLLLKPMLKFNPRRMRPAGASASATAAAAAAAAAAAGDSGGNSYGGFDVDGGDGVNIFGGLGDEALGGASLDDYDDDDDDDDDDALRLGAGDEGPGGSGIGGGNDGNSNDDTKSGIPQLKLIKPLHINYARRAKRVNVKRLKDNLWREIAAGGRRRSQPMDTAEPADISLDGGDSSEAGLALAGDQRFSDIVGGLKNVYPREKLEDLSVSYCFICLLHLANERNLRIESNASLSDLLISQDVFE
ncbi:hypothetical protein H4R18_002910 [Coemansia javaensis]|uniref:Condensin complex subunit 2 n=1 Tax=Coemansia javaensis TaxID=2761396 RepID=A0A9W8HFC8_9FUNG|nr:hypothetical protein H4R18_002910 [Coemansia javaensis]